MQNINFSKKIYQNNVFKGCVHILKRMQNKISEDQTYEVNTERPIAPEITAVLLKMGFDLDVFLSDRADLYSSIYISCKNNDTKGKIKSIMCTGEQNSPQKEKYKSEVKKYYNSKECDLLLKRVEKCLG